MTIAFYEHPRSSYVQIGSGRWERGSMKRCRRRLARKQHAARRFARSSGTTAFIRSQFFKNQHLVVGPQMLAEPGKVPLPFGKCFVQFFAP
jgi:hypothetical protein